MPTGALYEEFAVVDGVEPVRTTGPVPLRPARRGRVLPGHEPVGSVPAGTEPAGPVHRGSTGALGWVLGALALVTAGALAVPAQVPPPVSWGIVSDLGRPPVEQWSVDIESNTGGPSKLFLFPGTVVVADRAAIIGIDATSGARTWSVDARVDQCSRSGRSLTCVAQDDDVPSVLVVDGASGAVRRTPVPGAYSAVAHAGGLVVVRHRGEDYVVTRLAPDGEPMWSTTVGPVPPDYGYLPRAGIRVVGSELLIEGPHGAVLDVRTGAELVEDVSTYDDGGTWVVQPHEGGWTRLYPPAGEPRDLRARMGVMLRVDDDPGADLGGDARGAPAGDAPGLAARGGAGEPAVAAHPIARLAGRFVVTGAEGVHGVDAASGARLWSAALPTRTSCPCLGDGHVLMMTQWTADGVALLGLDVATGEQVWRVPMAGSEPVTGHATDGRSLYLIASDGVAAWALG